MDIAFVPVLTGTISGNGVLSFSYQANANETVDLWGIRIVTAGAASVIGIRDSSGRYFSNASQTNKLATTFFQDPTSDHLGFTEFKMAITLAGAASFYMDLLDTSGSSNAVTIALQAIKHLPA